MLTVPGVLQIDRHGRPCGPHALYFLFIRKGIVLIAFPDGRDHKRIEGLQIRAEGIKFKVCITCLAGQ